MIDYFALALGHGLMAIALLRLFFCDALDRDPLLEEIKQASRERRLNVSVSRRNARRRGAAEAIVGPDAEGD